MPRQTRPPERSRFAFSPRPVGTARVRRRRLLWPRFLVVASLLVVLAAVSSFFGFMSAIAQEVPRLDQVRRHDPARVGAIYAREGTRWRRLATLRSPESRVLVGPDEISPDMKHAIVAIEDRRFYQHGGVDPEGVLRAIVHRVSSNSEEGASTITQQFIKNAYLAPERTLRRKLREASLAYQLEHHWSKDKILSEYLNTIYFGHGTYGVEAAARYYFGVSAARLGPAQAALLAAIPKSPTEFDPIARPTAARARRNLVLDKMVEAGWLEVDAATAARAAPLLPRRPRTRPGNEKVREPYFVEYVTEQLVNRYGTATAFGGGLKVYTTLDLRAQARARQVVRRTLRGRGPQASLVTIDPASGRVLTMISGDEDFSRSQFNIATDGHLQPGSAFKPFVLLAALAQGIRPETEFVSKPQLIPHGDGTFWSVRNSHNAYVGRIDLDKATALSDNAVYAQLMATVGPARVVDVAHRLGISSPIDTLPEIALGGLRVGVTPLEMTHAFAAIANRGRRVGGSVSFRPPGDRHDPSVDPISIERIDFPKGRDLVNAPRSFQAVDENDALTAIDAMRGVVRFGTGRRASLGARVAVGKTGTTDDYRAAWFMGMTPQLTTGVWVGYPDRPRPMETEFNGEAVGGGTYPALIWRAFMRGALAGRPRLDWPRASSPPSATVGIDPRNGLRAPAHCPFARTLVLDLAHVPSRESECPRHLEVVPDLTGANIAEARRRVEGSGLRIRFSIAPAGRGDEPGRVTLQSPPALVSLPRRSVVDVQVAVAVPRALVPGVVGRGGTSVTEAVGRLTASGFRVVLEDGPLRGGRAGTVLDQEPSGGAQAPLHSVVHLTVRGAARGVTLPIVADLPLARARRRLVAAGLAVTAHDVEQPTRATDVVVSSDPPPGSVLPRGGIVALLTEPASRDR